MNRSLVEFHGGFNNDGSKGYDFDVGADGEADADVEAVVDDDVDDDDNAADAVVDGDVYDSDAGDADVDAVKRKQN